nr:retrovirus-related Pol polyprotein from transposon TNT 1-94 [Tanacetum cinerariifolium]
MRLSRSFEAVNSVGLEFYSSFDQSLSPSSDTTLAFFFRQWEVPSSSGNFLTSSGNALCILFPTKDNAVAIGYKNALCLTRAKQVQPALYNAYEIIKYNHVPAIVHNTEDILEIAEISRRKISDKMKDTKCVNHNVKIAPPDYSKENILSTFSPKKQLTLKQIFWSQDLIKMKFKYLKEYTTASRPIKALTVYPSNTPTTLVPGALTKEIKEIKDVFEELEAEVAQNVVDRKHDEIERKNLLIENHNLIVECLSKEVFFVAMKSELNVARYAKMHVANIIVEARCLELKLSFLIYVIRVTTIIMMKERELKYLKKIRTLKYYNESYKECIETLKKKLETLQQEKEGVDGKLAGLLTRRIYPGLDLSWTGLPECANDTVTDYSRPSPTAESISEDDQNRNTFVSETVTSPITSKPFIMFLRPKDSQSDSKTDKKETPKKPPVKYAEQCRKPNIKPKARGNQRNWNNLKSQQLGPDFVIKKKACFNCVRSPSRAPWVPTVNRNYSPVNRKFSTGSRNFPTANRKFPTASRKFPTGSTKSITGDMGLKGKAVKPLACWFWRPSHNLSNKGPENNSVSVMFKKYTYIDTQGRLKSVMAWVPKEKHMTGNISYLSDYEPYDGGYLSFGQGGCKITGKGTIKIECIVLRRDFKLLDDANILLRTPRQHNMYSIDLKNIVPHRDLTCLVAKASANECTKDATSQEVKKDVSSLRYIALPNWAHDALLEFSSKPSSDARLISKRVANQEETPSLDYILSLTNWFEDILRGTTNSDESNEKEVDIRNMETFITASPTPTLRIYKDHPKSQIIGPVDTPIQTKNKSKETLFIRKQREDFILVQVYMDDIIFGSSNLHLCREFEALMHDKFQMSAMGELNFFLSLQVLQKEDGIFLSQDKYVGDILKKFGYSDVRHQVTPKECHLHAAKRIFRYLKGHPKLGLWYPKELPFDLVSFSDSDYGGATQDRKSTTGGCQILGRRLISWIETTEERTKILATVDGIVRIVSESSLRRNLKLQDEEGISSLPDTKLFENITLMGYNISLNQKFTLQKGQFSHQWKYLIHTIMQCLSPKSTGFNEFSSNIDTALVCLATNRTYNFSKMIFDGLVKNVNNKSSVPPTVVDEPASPQRDVSQGEACPTESDFIADQVRATIDKSSTLPYNSAPRVTSPAAVKGTQEVEINQLKEIVKQLEEREGVAAINSGDDAPIKGRTTVLASRVVDVPTGSGSIPTASTLAEGSVPTGSKEVPTASLVFATATVVTPVTRRKGKEPKTKLLKHLDREDLNQLWRLVKETISTKPPITKDKEIFMLVEKDYPLRKGLALVMICYKLQVENFSQMANKLVLKIYMIANSPRQQGCSKHMTGDCSQLMNFMKKFIGTVRFRNDHFGAIMGYEDYVIGDSVISRVYYVEGLGHNLFSVRQFFDFDLEVAFRKHPCYVRDTDGVELIKGSRSSNLYTISVEDMMKSSLICLLSKASKNKSWLWHRRLNHLNFGTINDLARKDLVRGLPRLKFEKDHLCSVCQLGKRKKHTHKPKTENTNLEALNTIHMDLCGPTRVQIINGKKYILVIVDDYSRFTWVKFLRSKDETSEVVIIFLQQLQVGHNKTIRHIRTDNGNYKSVTIKL